MSKDDCFAKHSSRYIFPPKRRNFQLGDILYLRSGHTKWFIFRPTGETNERKNFFENWNHHVKTKKHKNYCAVVKRIYSHLETFSWCSLVRSDSFRPEHRGRINQNFDNDGSWYKVLSNRPLPPEKHDVEKSFTEKWQF
jgi:hypothetical protein